MDNTTFMEAVRGAVHWVRLCRDANKPDVIVGRFIEGDRAGKVAFFEMQPPQILEPGQLVPVVLRREAEKYARVACAFSIQPALDGSNQLALGPHDCQQVRAMVAHGWAGTLEEMRAQFERALEWMLFPPDASAPAATEPVPAGETSSYDEAGEIGGATDD